MVPQGFIYQLISLDIKNVSPHDKITDIHYINNQSPTFISLTIAYITTVIFFAWGPKIS
jgi:hypothetical protein